MPLASISESVAPPHGYVPADGEVLLCAENLHKSFRAGDLEITALDSVSLSVRRGEMIAIVGPSGSGKSTLLHLLGALDSASSGTVYFERKPLHTLGETARAEFHSRSVGFVWQRHHLLPDFTAAENVALPLLVRGVDRRQALVTACEWLEQTGLSGRAGQRAAQLSGGEQQRVAIARALVNRPSLLLADEPTGDLDEASAETVFELMRQLHRSHRLTSLLATHNLSLARRADRVLLLEHGLLQPAPASEGPVRTAPDFPVMVREERG